MTMMLLLLDISRWKISNVDMSWLFYGEGSLSRKWITITNLHCSSAHNENESSESCNLLDYCPQICEREVLMI
jgi:hypothetical protein